jgi:hypothetical protein
MPRFSQEQACQGRRMDTLSVPKRRTLSKGGQTDGGKSRTPSSRARIGRGGKEP